MTPPMRISAVHRAILENQHAIMLALLQTCHVNAAKRLRDRLMVTEKLTYVKPKPENEPHHFRPIQIQGHGVSDDER